VGNKINHADSVKYLRATAIDQVAPTPHHLGKKARISLLSDEGVTGKMRISWLPPRGSEQLLPLSWLISTYSVPLRWWLPRTRQTYDSLVAA